MWKLFTASGKIADNEVSRGYILEKAVEKAFGYTPEFTSKQTEHGTEYEPLAFDSFNEKYGPKFITAKPCGFIEIDENSGASPDGIVSDDAALELKCPYNPMTFFKLVYADKIQWEYKVQMQVQMMALKVEKCYFHNFCIVESRPYTYTLIEYGDPNLQSLITEAVAIAAVKRDEIAEQLIKKMQLQ